MHMAIPSRNTLYTERRSLDDFDVDTKGTPGYAVMRLLTSARLRGSDDDPERLLLTMMNNIWYVCAAVVAHPHAFLYVDAYKRLVESFYAGAVRVRLRKDATWAAVYLLLTASCTDLEHVQSFLQNIELLVKYPEQLRETARRLKSPPAPSDFAGTPEPPAKPRRHPTAKDENAPPDALVRLIDKALELGNEASLKELLVWLTTMDGAADVRPQVKRVEQRLKELKEPESHTTHNYYAGSGHISESWLKDVHIGEVPRKGTLPPNDCKTK